MAEEQIQISVLLSSIQDLPAVSGDLKGDDSFIVAQKDGSDWQTRKVGYQKIADSLDGKYNLGNLCAVYQDLSNVIDVNMVLSADIGNPYIISSITFAKGVPTALSGYRLSSALSVEPAEGFDQSETISVATMWFGGTSAVINIPKGKANLVSFVRWGLEN